MPLPEPSIFTKTQLAKRWKCGVPKIRGYIKDGRLKRAFNTLDYDFKALRETLFYRYDGNTNVLPEIKDEMPLIDLINDINPENIIKCPRYLYKSIDPNITTLPEVAFDKENLLESISTAFLAIASNQSFIFFRYFYDLDGNVLIPITQNNNKNIWKISLLSISRRNHDNLIISLEEIERFEIENGLIKKKKTQSVLIKRKTDILAIIKEFNYDPLAFPKAPSGKAGEKSEIRKLFLERHGQTLRNPFDKAWEALRKEGLIKDKE